MSNDMAATIIAKSDQVNASDLLGQPRTIRVVSVDVRPGTEQPVSIKIAGDDKVFRPCKSMCRLLVAAWGADSAAYAGRAMTIYNDPEVLWAGMKVGGIRISHMTDLDGPLTLALAENKKNRKPFTVKPLVIAAPKPAADKAAEWLASHIAAIKAAPDREAMIAVQKRDANHVNRLATTRPELFEQLALAVATRNAALDANDGGDPDYPMTNEGDA